MPWGATSDGCGVGQASTSSGLDSVELWLVSSGVSSNGTSCCTGFWPVAGLAVEGQEAAVGDLLAEVLRHPAVVAGRDVLDRLEEDEQHDQRDDADDDEHR